MRARRRALQRVDQDQQFHQVVVGRERRRLDDEAVLAADVLLDLDEDLHVGEALHLASGQGHAEVRADCLGQRTIAVAGNQLEVRTGRSPPSFASNDMPSSTTIG